MPPPRQISPQAIPDPEREQDYSNDFTPGSLDGWALITRDAAEHEEARSKKWYDSLQTDDNLQTNDNLQTDEGGSSNNGDLESRYAYAKAEVAKRMDALNGLPSTSSRRSLLDRTDLASNHETAQWRIPSREHDLKHQRNRTALSIKGTVDSILSELRLESAKSAFDNHGVSSLWVPFPRRTLRHFFDNPRDQKAFFESQHQQLNTSLNGWDFHRTDSKTTPFHAAFDDGEEIVMAQRVLGEGAYGVVEEVLLPTRSEPFVCVRKKIGRPIQLKAQKQIMAAFSREINVMRQVNHHHCVRLLGSYTDLESVNILSTPVADIDLATFLDQPLGDKQQRILYKGIKCLCNALNYLHQKSIRHEDLKPQNVLIYGDNILLTDFGFSLDFSDDSISTTTGRPSAWTIRYSAPEVLDFEPRNRASDIFSLGCVLYEMISGIQGHNLSDVKNHWKRVGNGQSSFARNPEAASCWLEPLPSSLGPRISRILKHLRLYISLMLDPNRLHRPSAQLVVDRLSDLSVLLHERREDVSTCCVSPPLQGIELTIKLSPWFEAEYFYPSLHDSWSFVLLDLDFQHIASKHPGYSSPEQAVSTLFTNFPEIVKKCETLYTIANRTGATKEFWQAHTKWKTNGTTLANAKDEVETSARLLSLKHFMFTFVRSVVHFPLDPIALHEWMVQISLLPICLPRSPNHGAFFYMLSYPITPTPVASMRRNLVEGVTDLTFSG